MTITCLLTRKLSQEKVPRDLFGKTMNLYPRLENCKAARWQKTIDADSHESRYFDSAVSGVPE